MTTTTATETAALQLVEIDEAAPALPAVQQQTAVQAVTPADLLRIATESGDRDMDRLERLMAMQERYLQMQERERERQAVLAFRRDFAAFRGENIIVPLTKEVDRGRAGSFTQAEYHVVADLLSPALSRHGFGFRHDVKFGARDWSTDGVVSTVPWVWVTCHLEHRDGHSEKLELEGPPLEQSANTPVQNMQGTASYLKRQSLLAITGTATGGEDDESRMRRLAGREPVTRERTDDGSPTLLELGEAAALEGTAALNAWWKGLKAAERNALMSDFSALRKAAAKADHDGEAPRS